MKFTLGIARSQVALTVGTKLFRNYFCHFLFETDEMTSSSRGHFSSLENYIKKRITDVRIINFLWKNVFLDYFLRGNGFENLTENQENYIICLLALTTFSISYISSIFFISNWIIFIFLLSDGQCSLCCYEKPKWGRA